MGNTICRDVTQSGPLVFEVINRRATVIDGSGGGMALIAGDSGDKWVGGAKAPSPLADVRILVEGGVTAPVGGTAWPSPRLAGGWRPAPGIGRRCGGLR